MRIAVLGSGAMGSVYGGMLAEGGHEVTLIDVWPEHVKAINERGLKLSGVSGDRTITVRATSDPSTLPTQDLVIVFVKSAFTKVAVANAIKIIGPETAVLTLQNGLGNAETIAALVGPEKVIGGITTHGATLLGPGAVYHAGWGETLIAEFRGQLTPRVLKLAEIFSAAGLETKAVENVDGPVWTKLLVNVGINALTAILRVKNGELTKHAPARELLIRAVKEGATVAKAKGITLTHSDPVIHCLEVAELTGDNISSMLQDVRAKRPTEIDVINGAIVAEGKKLDVATPVNEVLTLLVKAIEKTYSYQV